MLASSCLIGLGREAGHANGGLHVSVGVGDLQNLAALNAFNQNFNVAVGEFQALHDIDDGADLINFVGFWFVDGGIVLSRQKNLLVRSQGFFESAYARFAPHYERSHHERKDDHVPNGHHGQLSRFVFFLGCSH